jgi:hypothetical protein
MHITDNPTPPEDGPLVITRREWVDLRVGIGTAIAKLDQVLELRREDNRKINRLEERQDGFEQRLEKFDERVAKVELTESRKVGRRELAVMAFGAVSGALAVLITGAEWRELLKYILMKTGAQ